MDADRPGEPPTTKTRPTLWHRHFARLVADRAPPDIEIIAEPQLESIPSQIDLLLLRRGHGHQRDAEATVLRGLWPHIERAGIVEFKSPARPFRRNDLLHLTVYGTLYHCEERDRQALGKPFLVRMPGDLVLILVVPAQNRPLDDELAAMGWRCEPLAPGYARITGPTYPTLLVTIDEVCEAEKDEYLRLFSNYPVRDRTALYWWRQRTREMTMDSVDNIEGSDELYTKLLEGLPTRLRVAGLPAEEVLAQYDTDERLAGLPAEEVLAHYDTDERLAGLSPVEVLQHYGTTAALERFGPDILARAIRALPADIKRALIETLRED